MELDPEARVRASIAGLARAEGVTAGISHVCHACRRDLASDGVSASLRGPDDTSVPLHATGPRAASLADLQITLGEGPEHDALDQARPTLIPDLSSEGVRRRWPILTPAATQLGIAAVFAFPLQLGVIAVGVLTVVRTEPGWLRPEQLSMALLYADAALVMALAAERATDVTETEPAPHNGAFVDRWAQVHQATGMISAQLGVSIAEAFVRLRAHAFASGRSLTGVAADVITRKLRFRPGDEPRPHREPPPP